LTQAIIIFDKPKNGCKAYNLRSSLNSLKVPISVFTLVIFIDRLLVESIGSIVDWYDLANKRYIMFEVLVDN
jgi:hypothetical protein